LPALTVPTLAVHGEDDPIAPIGGVRAYADEVPAFRVRAFDGARHDILNESVHRQVAAAIVDFIGGQTAAA